MGYKNSNGKHLREILLQINNFKTTDDSALEKAGGSRLSCFYYERLLDVCKISQMYFDALVDKNWTKDRWPEQSKALEDLISIGRVAAESFLERKDDVFIPARETIRAAYKELLKTIDYEDVAQEPNLYACHYSTIDNFGSNMNKLKNTGYNFDTVICIADGGFLPAFVGGYAFPDSKILPIRYSYHTRNDLNIMLPSSSSYSYAADLITGKNILVVDDIVVDKVTAMVVLRNVIQYKPASIVFASVIGGQLIESMYAQTKMRCERIGKLDAFECRLR